MSQSQSHVPINGIVAFLFSKMNMSLQNEINSAIQDRMKILKMNKTKLASLSGISPQHIGKLLKGDRKWSPQMLDKTFDVLGVRVTFKTKHIKA